ncbi:MAG TPA: class I SAM-dependent methyltransferase [Spirochaetota bacterium]|nr:class I SAM-dependent methyltransferase [Spirochaetota bacterium]
MKNIKKKIQEDEYFFPYHYLDIKCDDYKYFHHADYVSYISLIVDYLGKIDKKNYILDAGCGDGRFCYEVKLRSQDANITGVDFSDRAISFAKAFNPNIPFLVKDLTKLKLQKKYDNIVLIEALEHIMPKDIEKILSSLALHLKTNGKIIISVPSINVPVHEKHYQHFSEESILRTLEPYFSVETVTGYAKLGSKRRLFNLLKNFGYLLYPLKYRIKPIYRYYNFIENYYKRNLAIGKPSECKGLIAICKKKK